MINQETNNQNNTKTCLEQALSYLENQGWSVIPVGTNKKPLIEWKKYQEEKPTKEEIIKWFTDYPTANIGIVTGKISNLIIIDIDIRHGGNNKAFNRITTITAKTGGGGWHYYFLYEEGVQNQVGIQQGIDIRGEGGFIIAPPSTHQSGESYEWIMSPGATEILPLPDFVKEWINEKGKANGKSNWNPEALNGVEEGGRNDSAASVAGKLLARFPITEWETEAWKLFQGWNSKNDPPLPEEELRDVFDSIKKREADKQKQTEKDQPVALQLVEEISKEQIVFFHDQYKEGYAAINGDGSEIMKLRSRLFRQYVARYVYESFGKIVSADILSNVIQVLEGKALFDGPQHELHVRIHKQDSAVWYDLGDGTVVHIDKDGWSISDMPPIFFKRYAHQSIQAAPKQGGNIKDLCDFININSEADRLLFLVFAVSAFIPGFPHPLIVLSGAQGAGKTTPLRLLKSLIDPSVLKTLSSPDSEREFVQLASHHYFLFLDNLSSLPGWLSDALARSSTGDGFSKRELYSDDDDVIYSFQRVTSLNGINLVVQKADLLDRSILLSLERIPKEKRREEQEFWNEFARLKPLLLGAIFDAVSGAIREYPSIQLTTRPRMADFARWGCAIAKTLGYTVDNFLSAYNSNISQQNEAALDASPAGTALIEYMRDRDQWEGPASELLTILEKQAQELKINIKSRDWPKDPSWLTRKLQLVHSNLAEKGIKVVREEKARPRRIIIQKTGENAVAPVGADAEDGDKHNHQTASEDNAVGVGDGGNGLSQQSSTEATPPTPLSPDLKEGIPSHGQLSLIAEPKEGKNSYSDKELEDVESLEFEEEETS